MPPRHVPEDALVDDAPGGATAASIAELEKRLTAQAKPWRSGWPSSSRRLRPPYSLDWPLPCNRLLPKAPSQPFPRARLRPRVVSKERKSPFLLSWTHSTPGSSPWTVQGPVSAPFADEEQYTAKGCALLPPDVASDQAPS
eukprot:jgi/Tetstr1/433150/TSEL_022482.t1